MKSIENLPDDVKASILEELSTSFVKKDDYDSVLKTKQDLLDEVKVAKRTKAEIEAAAETARMEAAAKNGDIESLKKSYEEKLTSLSTQIETYNNERKMSTVNSVAHEFINSSFVDDSFVREAMTVEFGKRLDVRDGNVVVLDPNGNLTANTVDDLKKEFLTNQKFAKHIVASGANGGGASTNTGKSKTAKSTPTDLTEVSLKDTPARLAVIRSRLNSI